jgi:hypothetical protein
MKIIVKKNSESPNETLITVKRNGMLNKYILLLFLGEKIEHKILFLVKLYIALADLEISFHTKAMLDIAITDTSSKILSWSDGYQELYEEWIKYRNANTHTE